MPYATNRDLPEAVKKLPKHKQDIFRNAFNNAWKEYADEQKAFAVAWAATKRSMDIHQLQLRCMECGCMEENYAVVESYDVYQALQALTYISNLLGNEARQEEPDHVAKLIQLFKDLMTFIGEELDEALVSASNDFESEEETRGYSGYLVEGKDGKHLPTGKDGKASPRLMGAAWAALHSGFRGRKYAGADKEKAIAKLAKLYKAQGKEPPSTRAFEEFEETLLHQAYGKPPALRSTGETRFAGYAFLWPKDKQKDLDLLNTYFEPDTDYGSYYRSADILYHHGMELTMGLERIGKAVRAEIDDIGLWVEGELDKSKKYWKGVAELIRQGKLYWSGGTAGHLIRYADDGLGVRSFPIVEWSLTPTPGQPRLDSVEFLRSVGIDVDNHADGEVDGEASEISDGQKHDDQKRSVRNAEPPTSKKTKNFMEVLMEDKEQLAQTIAESVRAAMKAEADARAQDEKAAKAKQEEEVRAAELAKKQHEELVEKVTAEVRAKMPVQQDARPFPAGSGQYQYIPRESLGEFSFLKACRGIVLSFWGKPNPWSGAEKERDTMTKHADEVRATLSENIGSLGAYLVPPQYVQEQLIPLLRSRAVVRAANPVVMQANSNVVYIPSQTGGATAYWVGENATLTASNLTVGQMAITIKKLAGLEYVSNELLADSNPSVDQLMRQDLAAVLALAEDTAYLSGDGTGNQPVGMSNYAGITSLTCASDSGNGGAIQAADIFYMKRKMMQNNIPNDNWAWFCSPRTWDEIAQLKDSQNRYLLETLTGGNISQYPAYGTYPNGPETSYLGSVVGRLLGWPVFVTNNISETQTQGTTATCSSLYLVRMSDVIIAERAGLELMATNVAGTSFATDQTWIRAIMRVGFGIRHAPAIEVMKGLT